MGARTAPCPRYFACALGSDALPQRASASYPKRASDDAGADAIEVLAVCLPACLPVARLRASAASVPASHCA